MENSINNDFRFPEQIKHTVGTLRHSTQWHILELLIANNDHLSYTELKSNIIEQGSSRGDLNYHLNELEKSGWIENKSNTNAEINDKYNSYYYVSKFGLKLLEGIMNALKRDSYQDNFDFIKYGEKISESIANTAQETTTKTDLDKLFGIRWKDSKNVVFAAVRKPQSEWKISPHSKIKASTIRKRRITGKLHINSTSMKRKVIQ